MYSFHHRWIRRFSIILVIVLALLIFIKRDAILDKVFNRVGESSAAPVAKNIDNQSNDLAAKDYTNQQTIPVANNQPDFKQSELETKKGGWLDLSRRDWLGRPKQANAMLDKSRMPTEKEND
ncbi:hypothetical protein AB0Y21_05910 [Weissella paramesenteroides]|uniref:hypothetical protein n=1 Tax=Weissella paramesenteroides TaxID=1249 RepID=UPI003F1E58F2